MKKVEGELSQSEREFIDRILSDETFPQNSRVAIAQHYEQTLKTGDVHNTVNYIEELRMNFGERYQEEA